LSYLQGQQKVEIELLDKSGRRLYYELLSNVFEENKTLYFSSMGISQKGIYLLKITSNNIVRHQKVILN